MATTRKKKLVSASNTKSEPTANQPKKAAPVGNATGLRIGAVALWLAAIGLEVVALLILNGTISWTFMSSLAQIIIVLVLDLVCVIIGAQLWKKANHIDPASEKNKLKFWLWNNMGLIACALAFIPFVILALTNKNADKKTKTIASVVAIIALLIGGLVSYEWNPISEEAKQAAVDTIEGDVFWSTFGKKYHTDQDCQHLNQSDTLTYGTVEEAIAAGRTELCKTCAKHYGETHDLEGVRTEGGEVIEAEPEPAE